MYLKAEMFFGLQPGADGRSVTLLLAENLSTALPPSELHLVLEFKQTALEYKCCL